MNKANGNPATGAALNAEMLGGVAASQYPTQAVIEWTPHLYGSNGAEITLSIATGRAVITGKSIVCEYRIEILSVEAASGYIYIKGFPFVILPTAEFSIGGAFTNMNTTKFSNYSGTSVIGGTGLAFRQRYAGEGQETNLNTISVSDIKATTKLTGTFSTIIQ